MKGLTMLSSSPPVGADPEQVRLTAIRHAARAYLVAQPSFHCDRLPVGNSAAYACVAWWQTMTAYARGPRHRGLAGLRAGLPQPDRSVHVQSHPVLEGPHRELHYWTWRSTTYPREQQ